MMTSLLTVHLLLLKERASYLDRCAQTGMALYTLQDIAINQLYAIELLHLENPRTIMEEELQYVYRRVDDAITVAECKTMNCIVQAICRKKDSWWKTE